nr:hypothetical protein [Tanacetum cinerariifolium]
RELIEHHAKDKTYVRDRVEYFHKDIDEFLKLAGDLAAIDTPISYKDHALLLLTSLPSSYDNSKELQKITEAKGDGGEGLYVRAKSSQRDMEQGTYSAWSKSQGKSSRLMCYICQSKKHLKRDCPRYNYKKSQGFVVSGSEADGECRVRGTGKVRVQMRDGSSFVLNNVRNILEDKT